MIGGLGVALHILLLLALASWTKPARRAPATVTSVTVSLIRPESQPQPRPEPRPTPVFESGSRGERVKERRSRERVSEAIVRPPQAAQDAPSTDRAAAAEVAEVASEPSREAGPAPGAASAPPLRLGDDVIRAAVQQARASAPLIAESAGAGSKATRLADGIASAGKPDCLQPEREQGGGATGLLRLPSLIADALTGKCK